MPGFHYSWCFVGPWPNSAAEFSGVVVAAAVVEAAAAAAAAGAGWPPRYPSPRKQTNQPTPHQTDSDHQNQHWPNWDRYFAEATSQSRGRLPADYRDYWISFSHSKNCYCAEMSCGRICDHSSFRFGCSNQSHFRWDVSAWMRNAKFSTIGPGAPPFDWKGIANRWVWLDPVDLGLDDRFSCH